MSAEGPVFPVAFDELAAAEDLARLGDSGGGAKAFVEFAREIERLGGLPIGRLMACESEGRDGTRLANCVKTYVPWPAGRSGLVMVSTSRPKGSPVRIRASAWLYRASYFQEHRRARVIGRASQLAASPEPTDPRRPRHRAGAFTCPVEVKLRDCRNRS